MEVQYSLPLSSSCLDFQHLLREIPGTLAAKWCSPACCCCLMLCTVGFLFQLQCFLAAMENSADNNGLRAQKTLMYGSTNVSVYVSV